MTTSGVQVVSSANITWDPSNLPTAGLIMIRRAFSAATNPSSTATVRILAACNAKTARSVTCGLLCEADEHSRKLARLSPGVSDGDDATIRSLLVAQLEHRHARGQRPGDQLGD